MRKLWVGIGKDDEMLVIDKGEELFTIVGGHPAHLSEIDRFLTWHECKELVESPIASGAFYPRMWRGKPTPMPRSLSPQHVAEWVANVRANRMLFSRLETLFAAIEPNQEQDNTYGLLQREILILACTLVESAWRSVLEANHASPQSGKPNRWSTNDYVRLLTPMRLAEWRVSLSAHHDYRDPKPFRSWDPAEPTKSLPWYDAYNAVKHGWESALRQATFGAAVDAAAAAFIMSVAQFGPGHLTALPGSADQYFHPDVFSVESWPKWLPTERYIEPSQKGIDRGTWIGHERWEPTFCPELDDS